MKAAEPKSSTTSQSLQTKSEEQHTPFFDKDGGNSVLTNESKEFHFFDNNSSNSNKKIPFFSKPFVQTKLTIGQPGDKYEQEADAMADKVGQRLAENNNGSDQQSLLKNHTVIQLKPIFESEAEPSIQAKSLNGQSLNPIIIQPRCAECEDEENLQKKEDTSEDEELQMKPIFDSATTPPDDNSIQRKCAACAHEEDTIQSKAISVEEEPLQAKAEAAPSPAPSLESRLKSSKGGGLSLPEDTRSKMEGAFGSNFSGVRVHTDSLAVQMNKELGAQAFTHGSDVYFNAGKYNPKTSTGRHLIAHELTHSIQQGSSLKNSLNKTPNIQKACPPDCQDTLTERLYVEVDFKESVLIFMLAIDTSTLEFFNNNENAQPLLEEHLRNLFTPETGPIHETPEYLSGNRVKDLLERDARAWARNGGVISTPLLSNLITARIRSVTENALLYKFEQFLESTTNFDPATLDWIILIPQLKARLPWEPTSLLEASDFDLYQLVLSIMLEEAQEDEPVLGAVHPDLDDFERIIFDQFVLNTLTIHDFTEETLQFHSEKFLFYWLPQISDLQYVPNNFDIESFRPLDTEEDIEEERERILNDFIEYDVPGLMIDYLLDEWATSGVSPEAWLDQLEIEHYREGLLDYLVDQFMEISLNDPHLMVALRIAAIEEARFRSLNLFYSMATGRETYNDSLGDLLSATPLEELSEDEFNIANDPYTYFNVSSEVARATYALLNGVEPGGAIGQEIIEFATDILAVLEYPQEMAGIFLLPQLLSTLQVFSGLIDEQEARAREAIREGIDVNYDDIAEVIQNVSDHADSFIRDEWIPMLKEVAIEKLTENRDELQSMYDNWDVANLEFAMRLRGGAREYEDIARNLEAENYESIELGGQIVTKADASRLRDAAQFMRDEANIRTDPEGAQERKEELLETIELYETVKQNIEDDEYDPLDYSGEVYVEARRRLGISEFPRFTTTLQVLRGDITAEQNPFLARTIVAWHWSESSERAFEELMLVGGQVFLSIASMLLPGIGGLVLKAIDLAVSIGMGIHQVKDAQEILDMARLDTRQDLRGISVEQAENALMWAWIGMGLTIVLEVGEVALAQRLKVVGAGGVELPPSTRHWENRLNRQTRRMLRNDPELRRFYAQLDPRVRRLLTKCSSPCIPTRPRPSAHDISRIERLIDRFPELENHRGLREYLNHPLRRRNLTPALDSIENARSVRVLESRLNRAIAADNVLEAGASAKLTGGRWKYTKPGGTVIHEYEISTHGFLAGNRGTENFFQSHHGIQDAWARRRVPGFDREACPAILLRDSRKGSPHQIITSRQASASRRAGRGTRTYEAERQLVIEDMQAAGVPNNFAQELLAESDNYFGRLYRQIERTNPASLTSIFGSWTP